MNSVYFPQHLNNSQYHRILDLCLFELGETRVEAIGNTIEFSPTFIFGFNNSKLLFPSLKKLSVRSRFLPNYFEQLLASLPSLESLEWTNSGYGYQIWGPPKTNLRFQSNLKVLKLDTGSRRFDLDQIAGTLKNCPKLCHLKILRDNILSLSQYNQLTDCIKDLNLKKLIYATDSGYAIPVKLNSLESLVITNYSKSTYSPSAVDLSKDCRQRNLSQLGLIHCKNGISDFTSAMKYYACSQNLVALNINRFGVGLSKQDYINHIAKKFPNLKVLSAKFAGVDDATVAAIIEWGNQSGNMLEQIALSRSTYTYQPISDLAMNNVQVVVMAYHHRMYSLPSSLNSLRELGNITISRPNIKFVANNFKAEPHPFITGSY